jgi:hypothetical protein
MSVKAARKTMEVMDPGECVGVEKIFLVSCL